MAIVSTIVRLQCTVSGFFFLLGNVSPLRNLIQNNMKLKPILINCPGKEIYGGPLNMLSQMHKEQ